MTLEGVDSSPMEIGKQIVWVQMLRDEWKNNEESKFKFSSDCFNILIKQKAKPAESKDGSLLMW